MGKNIVDVQKILQRSKEIVTGNRIPRNFFITSGVGESNVTIHAGSYHHALRDAGIEMCNIITYSSIMPSIATEVPKPEMVHGSVLETISAVATSKTGRRATAGIIIGWLYKNGEKYGGLVCEYNGNDTEKKAEEILHASLNELYLNGYSDMELKDIRLITRSFVPKKKFGTAIVAICFTDYVHPLVD